MRGGRVGCKMGMGWVVGSKGAKVLGKHKVARSAKGERSAPYLHDYCMNGWKAEQIARMASGSGMWSRMLHDEKTVSPLLRQRVLTSETGCEDAGGKRFGERGGEAAMVKGWGTPGMRVYGQGAREHAPWGTMFTGAIWRTWRDARPGGARARERGS